MLSSPLPSRPALAVCACALALLLSGPVACGPGADEAGEPEAAAGPERVVNEELGLAYAVLPAGFRVAENEGSELVLERASGEGTLAIELGPVETAGINLQDEVWRDKESYEARPGGEYLGQNELGGVALGTAYASRGRYAGEGGETVEERHVLALHPTENRLVRLVYAYPLGDDSQERFDHLVDALSRLEPAAGAAEPEATEATEAPVDGAEGEASPAV